ncbi:phage minor head protein [Kiritimatiellaeota bacterium B1221]|nr:phage minor head protein [Kiritimatiellaeota bacterium B1221]
MTFTTSPIPNDEAAAMIADKPVFKKAAYDKLLPELKGRAFTMAGIEDADILSNVRGMLAEVPKGADWKETRTKIAEELLKEWGDPNADEETQQKIYGRAMKRAEFNLRFHTFQSYQAGRWQTMQNQKDVFPYWQYVAFGDNRVRPTHEALDGLILSADDPFWHDHYPPWEWGCRCLVRALSEDDYLEELERDQDRDPADRKILPDVLRDRMRDTGQLQRGTQTLDVRSPKQKLEAKGEDPGKAFGWNPADLRIPIEDIKGRYDAKTFTTFENWARAEKIDDGRTVWAWLNGDPILPPSAPAKLPPVPPVSVDKFLEDLKLDQPDAWTEADWRKVRSGLKKPDGLKAKDVITGVRGADKTGTFSESHIRDVVEEFLAFVPRSVATSLPKFQVKVVRQSNSMLGAYSEQTRELILNKKAMETYKLKTGLSKAMAETTYHELTHWVHDHGPKSFGDEMRDLFAERTKGESFFRPGPGQNYKQDRWYTLYAGRVYDFENKQTPPGSEVATTHMQLFSDPAEAAAKVAYAQNGDTIVPNLKRVLKIFTGEIQ